MYSGMCCTVFSSMSVRQFSDVCEIHFVGEIVYQEYLRPDLIKFILRGNNNLKKAWSSLVFSGGIFVALFSSYGLRNEIYNT